MPANPDHIRRDAEHAARSIIRVEIMKYVRRLDDAAKAHIAEALADAEPGAVLDGTAIGFAASRSALAAYLGSGSVHEAIEASTDQD